MPTITESDKRRAKRNAEDAKRFSWLAKNKIEVGRGLDSLVFRTHEGIMLNVTKYTDKPLTDWREGVDAAWEVFRKKNKSKKHCKRVTDKEKTGPIV